MLNDNTPKNYPLPPNAVLVTNPTLHKATCDIADLLHRLLCNWNHCDGCSWEYESWRDDIEPVGEHSARYRYYHRAAKLLSRWEPATLKRMLSDLIAS